MGSGTGDRIKGRVKQAIGSLTGDRTQKREGQVDEKAGDLKDAAEDLIDKGNRRLKR